MLEKIGEEALGNGMTIEWAWCDDVESPRTWEDNLGHMFTWARGYSSPDEHGYKHPEDFMKSMLEEHFTFEELAEAVRSGMFESLRLEKDEHGHERLEAMYRSWLTGEEAWGVVEDYGDYPDSETLSEAIAQCAEATVLLSQAVVLKTVYMLDHSGVAYSTRDFRDRWDSGAVGFIWADEDDVSSWFGGVPTSMEKASKRLDFEVGRYSQWVGGETYAVMLSDAEGNVLDFVCGYIGDDGLEVGIEDMREQAKRAA